MDTEKIGAILVKLRGDRTQMEVAAAIGTCQSALAMYENGTRIPSDEVKKRIAKYYNKTVQEIFFD